MYVIDGFCDDMKLQLVDTFLTQDRHLFLYAFAVVFQT